MPPEDARVTIARLIAANPRIRPVDLAKQAKVTRQRVHQLLEDMEYRLDCVWKRDAKRGGKR